MAWTPPSFASFGWQDNSSTPLSAAELNSDDGFLATYARNVALNYDTYAQGQFVHQDGTGLPSSVVSAASVPSIEAYGHSWISEFGATNVRYGYIERLARMLGNATVNKLGTNGGQVANVAANGGVPNLLQNGVATDLTAGRYVTRGGLKVCQVGFNDYPLYQAVTNGPALVEAALTAAFSRLLAARIIPALTAGPVLNAALTYTGAGWTAFPDATLSIAPGFAYNTTTQGCSVSFATDASYNGEAISCLLTMGAAAQAIYTLSWDGTNVATVNGVQLGAAVAAGGQPGATIAIRVPAGVIPAGVHTIAVTCTSVTTAAIGGFIIEGSAPLIVPSMPYDANASYPNAKADWSNTRNQNVIANFPTAKYVDLMPALSPNYPSTTADVGNWAAGGAIGHPTNLGNQGIAAVLQPIIRGVLTPAVAAAMN